MKDSSKLREYAHELAEDIYGQDSILFLDPLTILAIIQAIAAIVSLWKNCQPSVEFTPKMMRSYLHAGGPVRQRMRRQRMEKAIRQSLTEDEIELLGGSEKTFVHYLVASTQEENSNFDAAFAEVMSSDD